MLKFLRKILGDKRGNALLMVAGAMPMIVGAAGLASDTIQWTLWKRQLQRAADSAAVAGVYAKMAGQDVTTQVTNDTTKNNQTGITLLTAPVITFPAAANDWTNPVAVQLQVQKTLSFSSMFMSTTPIITANATAAAVQTGDYCVVSLESTNTTGITAGGNANVDLGCGMITNSISMDAAVAFGSSLVNASPVAAVGGLDKTDNWATGTTLLPFTIPQPDPFASVPAPTIPSPCNNTINDKPSDNTTVTAGCYKSMTVQGTMHLGDGTYVITGDININSQAKIDCNACTLILTNNSPSQTGKITVNGGAQLNLKAPLTGTYAGLMFYQNRGATSGTTNKINGNSSSTFQGAVYFPSQNVEFTGTSGVTYQCIELVARQVSFLGNSQIKNNCPTYPDPDKFKGRHVRLVA